VDTSSHPSVFISHYNGHVIKLVRPLSTVDNTRDYARVSHSRQWSNYNITIRGYAVLVLTNFLGQLSLVIHSWVGAVSTDRYSDGQQRPWRVLLTSVPY